MCSLKFKSNKRLQVEIEVACEPVLIAWRDSHRLGGRVGGVGAWLKFSQHVDGTARQWHTVGVGDGEVRTKDDLDEVVDRESSALLLLLLTEIRTSLWPHDIPWALLNTRRTPSGNQVKVKSNWGWKVQAWPVEASSQSKEDLYCQSEDRTPLYPLTSGLTALRAFRSTAAAWIGPK